MSLIEFSNIRENPRMFHQVGEKMLPMARVHALRSDRIEISWVECDVGSWFQSLPLDGKEGLPFCQQIKLQSSRTQSCAVQFWTGKTNIGDRIAKVSFVSLLITSAPILAKPSAPSLAQAARAKLRRQVIRIPYEKSEIWKRKKTQNLKAIIRAVGVVL